MMETKWCKNCRL